jgi:hypothetical protein
MLLTLHLEQTNILFRTVSPRLQMLHTNPLSFENSGIWKPLEYLSDEPFTLANLETPSFFLPATELAAMVFCKHKIIWSIRTLFSKKYVFTGDWSCYIKIIDEPPDERWSSHHLHPSWEMKSWWSRQLQLQQQQVQPELPCAFSPFSLFS